MSQIAKRPTLQQNAKREAWTVIMVLVLALLWSLGYCYLQGYQHAAESWVVQAGLATARTPGNFQHILGVPDWVFVGILVPWLMCAAFTVGFCLGITDDDLGREAEDEPRGL